MDVATGGVYTAEPGVVSAVRDSVPGPCRVNCTVWAIDFPVGSNALTEIVDVCVPSCTRESGVAWILSENAASAGPDVVGAVS